MSLRSKLAALLLLAISSTFSLTATAAQPNIVFVLVDDLDLSVWNTALGLKDVVSGQPILPTIKSELIDHGTTFEQMFVSQSLCCPSRTTLHTGQYPQNHGVVGNHGVYQQYKDSQEKLALGLWMHNAGYRTGYFGKYMNESGMDHTYKPAGWDTWRALVPPATAGSLSSTQCMYGYSLHSGVEPPDFFGTLGADGKPIESEYQTDVLARLAADFIGTPDDKPFLLVVAPMSPHTENCNGVYKDTSPVEVRVRTAKRYLADASTGRPDLTPKVALPQGPAYDEAKMDDKPLWMQELRKNGDLTRRTNLYNDKIAAMRPVDDMVKKLIDKLRFMRKFDNTLIVFTSDNGFQYGTHRLSGKEDLYEESIRVPMVVRAPGQRKPYVSQEWVLNNDWAPTIAEYGQATALLTVDGRSFKPLMDDPTAKGTRKTFMVRSGNNPAPGARMSGLHISEDGDDNEDHRPFLMVRSRNAALTGDTEEKTVWVYAETYQFDGIASVNEKELYNLTDDLYQERSAHKRSLQRVQALQPRLLSLKNCRGNSLLDPNSCRSLEDK